MEVLCPQNKKQTGHGPIVYCFKPIVFDWVKDDRRDVRRIMGFLNYFIKTWDKKATALCAMCIAGGVWLFFTDSSVTGNIPVLIYYVLVVPTGIALGRYEQYSKKQKR